MLITTSSTRAQGVAGVRECYQSSSNMLFGIKVKCM